jgi:hypothetical protein
MPSPPRLDCRGSQSEVEAEAIPSNLPFVEVMGFAGALAILRIDIPRTQPIAISTRVFDALWWCAVDPGSIVQLDISSCRSRLYGAARRALHRVRDTREALAGIK